MLLNMESRRIYTVGTLSYSRSGLIVLFGWLLWGDFIFTLMESVMPSLLPLILKANGASNREIIVVVSTLYMIFNAALNPIISYSSDRFRSRWGRRRPFIIVTTPFVVLFLCAIPFGGEIFKWLSTGGSIAGLLAWAPCAPLILVFGVLVAGFQVFNMFVSSVYYYLIADVVPRECLGQFYGLFRVCGALAGIVFNYFIFGLAEAHFKSIFCITAAVYGVVIVLMCLNVKEGTYPQVTDERHGHWWSGIQNYGRECFGHRYYWWVFLAYTSLGLAGAGNVFSVFFFTKELGVSLELFGKITAWSGVSFLICAYPFGIIIDRWGCHRALIASMTALTLSSILMFFFATDAVSGAVWAIIRGLPLSLSAMAIMKWTVEVYPRDRYGQFGSASALFSSLCGIVLGPVCGWVIDSIAIYRFFLIWSALFTGFGIVAAIIVHRKWLALGGLGDYRAP
jgi:MFS family permease